MILNFLASNLVQQRIRDWYFTFFCLEKRNGGGKVRRNSWRSRSLINPRREIQWRSVILRFVMVFLRAIEIFLRSGGNDSSRTSLSFSIRKQRPGLCRWKIICFFFLVAIIKKEFNDNSLRKGGRKKEKTDVTFFHADTNTLPRSIDFFFLLLSQ